MKAQLWGGRFEGTPSELMQRLNDSFSFDRELFTADIEASIAWAAALAAAGVLTATEAKRLTKGLKSIETPGRDDQSHEDVHSYIEASLYDAVGAVAGKLHTGRSRNDQVATALRLWLRNASEELKLAIKALAHVLALRAREHAATAMPGYTHLKQAEPITFGHWCLAYHSMLQRDLSRLEDAIERANECPLGSGALSGTPLPIDRQALATSLGFARPTANSLDAVSDRDAAAEYLFIATMLFSHLSRMAEDLIFFSSDEARYVELPDAFTTGSSRMPHKKNPDVLELLRGHAARLIGELTGLLALLKGLPLAYNKDLQLDKEPLFRTKMTADAALPALTGLLGGLVVREDVASAAASNDLLLATELADALAARGVPFREAHQIASTRIGESIRTGRSLRELGPSASITAADLESLDVGRALSRRNAIGGTAPGRVFDAASVALQDNSTNGDQRR